jgi:putative oxidoreductase
VAQRSKGKTIALWVLSGLLAALFLMAGGSKLAGAEQHVEGFKRWGFPQGFRLVVGAVEVVAAGLLLVPRTAFFSAAALVVVMAGAIYTHLFRATGEGAMVIPPLVLMGLAAVVGYARRPDALRQSAGGGKREA